MGFAPIVRASEQAAFEEFAYDYFGSRPDYFPPGTGINPFGKGIWRMGQNKTRMHDSDVATQERGFVTPIIQCCIDNPGDKILLFNLHSEPSRRRTINGIVGCAEKISAATAAAASVTKNELQEASDQIQHTAAEHISEAPGFTTAKHEAVETREEVPTSKEVTAAENQPLIDHGRSYPDYSCGSMTDFVNIVRFRTRGPASIMFQPVYPADSPWMVRGLVLSPMAWDEIFEDVFSSKMHGVHAVLESETKAFTYTIEAGKVESL